MQTGGWTSTKANTGTNTDGYEQEDADTHIDMGKAMEGQAKHRTWDGPWYKYDDEDEDEDTHKLTWTKPWKDQHDDIRSTHMDEHGRTRAGPWDTDTRKATQTTIGRDHGTSKSTSTNEDEDIHT